MALSKFAIYDSQIKAIIENNNSIIGSWSKIAKLIRSDLERVDHRNFEHYIRRHHKRIVDTHEGVYEATDSLDVDNTTVKHLWIKNKGASLFIKNPNFSEPESEPEKEIDFLSIFKDKITPIIVKPQIQISKDYYFDRLIQ